MKTSSQFGKPVLPLVMALALSLLGRECMAQVNAFTYQGRLTESGNPANGSFDLRFILYTADIGGSQVGPVLTNSAVEVTSGLFTTTLDFGNGAFTSGARWLEIAARTNASGSFTPLNPRQPVTPAPQALYASQAGSAVVASTATAATTASSVPWAGITGVPPGFADGVDDGGSFSAGTGLTLGGTIFSLDTSYTDGRYWKLGGNSGTTPGTHFLGTIENQALELKVNNQRAMRIEPNGVSPNIIEGYGGNTVSAGVYGATIGGGGASGVLNRIFANYSTISGGYNNTIQSGGLYAIIGGGFGNSAAGSADTVGGGDYNSANGGRATISGGTQNIATGDSSTVGGGYFNIASTDSATIGGGVGNTIAGVGNIFGGQNATIAGGAANTNNAYCGAIGGGILNSISTNDCSYSTIGGGQGNTITLGEDSTISGGVLNNSSGYYSTIAGGAYNSSVSFYGGTIGGGFSNIVTGDYAIVPGGYLNAAVGNYSYAAGRRAKANHAGAFVWADSSNADIASTAANQFTVRAAGGVRFFSNSGATAGVSLAANGTSWAVISDRNEKKNFSQVDGKEVLAKLVSMPVEKWNYNWEADTETPNIGPMAQDFKASFYPGRDDKSITTLEFDGVALAAIQGLNQKLAEAVAAKDLRIADMEKRLEILESLLLPQTQGAQ
jgi:hypothetical protein